VPSKPAGNHMTAIGTAQGELLAAGGDGGTGEGWVIHRRNCFMSAQFSPVASYIMGTNIKI